MNFRRSFPRLALAGTISLSALALALAVADPAYAQSEISTLQGRVEGAAPDTRVTATDLHTGQRLTGKIDANGNFVILGVRPSQYKVEVPGRPAKTVTVLVGQNAVVDFSESSDIVVTAERTVREVRTATVTTNITTAQIENLPQSKRNFLSFADLAPGMSVSRGDNAQVQAGAIASQNVNVLLDGMSLKNPINHGGIFGQNFGLGNPFPQNAIQEYKVETQNFGAETGQTGSALITAITKTGGDEFHGGAFIQFQPNWMIEQPYFDKKNNVPKPVYNRKQFGGELGGPIIPGKLTFYVAGEGTSQNLPGITRSVTSPVPLNYAEEVNSTANADFKQGLYFGKLTFFATDDDTINLSGFIRRENNLSDVDSNATDSHARTIKTHQDRYQLNWRHNGDDWFNNFNIAYDRGTQSTPSLGTGPEFVLSNDTAFGVVMRAGAHFFEQADDQKVTTISDDATFIKGAHTLKVGGQLVFMDLNREVNDHFNGSYYYLNPGAVANFDPLTAIPYGAVVNLTPTANMSAKNTQIGLYVADEWKPDDHWTFNFGIRWDYESNANNKNYVTPAAIAAALRAYKGWQAAGINPEDYISDGSNRKAQWDRFQPRFGFAYDVHGDRDLVIFGGAGRYYDRSLFIEGVIETLTNTNKVVNVPFCSASVTAGCLNFSNSLRDVNTLRTAASALFPGGGSVFVMDNDTRLPFSDQFNIGVRKRFGEIQTSLTLSHIRSHNIFMYERANYYENGWYTRFVNRDANGNVTGCTDGGNNWVQDSSPGSLTNGDGSAVSPAICAAQNAQLPGFSGKLNRGSFSGKANYTAIYLQIEKPFTDTSDWGITSTLTVQWAKSNVAQELNSDEFYNGTDMTGFGDQKVNGVEDWRWVTAANARVPWGITLGANLTLSSGPRFGSLLAGWNTTPALNVPDGACCIANFGGVYSPKPFIGYKRLDLRVAKTFRMPYGQGHDLTIDFQAFNVFNWLNRTYSSWGAGGGLPAPLEEDTQISRDARSFQAGLKYSF